MVEGVKPSKMVFFFGKNVCTTVRCMERGKHLAKSSFFVAKMCAPVKGYGQRERQFSGLTLLMVIF